MGKYKHGTGRRPYLINVVWCRSWRSGTFSRASKQAASVRTASTTSPGTATKTTSTALPAITVRAIRRETTPSALPMLADTDLRGLPKGSVLESLLRLGTSCTFRRKLTTKYLINWESKIAKFALVSHRTPDGNGQAGDSVLYSKKQPYTDFSEGRSEIWVI